MTHHHEVQNNLSFEEKLVKLLEHWLKHNEDHSKTYRDWAQKAKENKIDKAASLIEDAARMTDEINRKLQAALESLPR